MTVAMANNNCRFITAHLLAVDVRATPMSMSMPMSMSAMGLNKASHEVDEVVVPRLLSVAVDVAVSSRVVKMVSKMALHRFSSLTTLCHHLPI
jgi:hypothetical protein